MNPGERKIILADSLRAFLDLDRTFLHRNGFRILIAADGLEALALASIENPHVVILDQAMEGLTGSQACSEIKARDASRRVPVIVSSESATAEVRSLCRAAGADAFVPRSVGRGELLKTIARILRVPERRDARTTIAFEVTGEMARQYVGRALDLSESGLGMDTNRRFPVHTQLNMRFVLPGERDEILTEARVARSYLASGGVWRLGVEFVGLTPEARDALRAYLERRRRGR